MAEILHHLIGILSHYLQGFLHSRWCRISAINSSWWLNQPILKKYSSNWIIFARIGVKVKNIGNHHLECEFDFTTSTQHNFTQHFLLLDSANGEFMVFFPPRETVSRHWRMAIKLEEQNYILEIQYEYQQKWWFGKTVYYNSLKTQQFMLLYASILIFKSCTLYSRIPA